MKSPIQIYPSIRLLTIILVIFFFGANDGFSQKNSIVKHEDLSGRQQKMYEESVQQLRLGFFEEGLSTMSKLLDKEPDCIDCLVQLASAHFDRHEYWLAIPLLKKILDLDPDYRPMAWVILGESLFFMEEYPEAKIALEIYLSAGHKEGKWTRQARKILLHADYAEKAKLDPVDLRVYPITDLISSPEMEYHPSLTANGQMMVFTRKIDGQEDLMVSSWQDSIWSIAFPLESINSRGNEGAHCISADGKTIVFTSCDKREGLGSCDLYISEWTGTSWTIPNNMGPVVNSPAWESMPSLSANGEWLYFSSNRRGGQGGTDIWITRRSVDGGWVIPFNAGPVINTRGNEESPFLHHDGRTLYFMSEGHPGFGGQDLFFAQKNEKHKWSTPINLGYPINTSSQEGGINVAIDGGIAYMFTDRSGSDRTDPKPSGDFNIIAIELPEKLQPRPVTYLELTIRDKITRKPLQANIEAQSLPSNELYNKGEADQQGKYLICLPAGNEFLFNIEKQGYVMHSDRIILLDENSEMAPLSREIFLRPISNEIIAQPGDEVVFKLENIFFATGSDSLMESSRFEIDRLAYFLKKNPDLKIEVRGHTDNVGTEENNLKLSEARARSVYLALISEGVSGDRMRFRGFGESLPVATNDTEEGRSQNRRTEFVILSE